MTGEKEISDLDLLVESLKEAPDALGARWVYQRGAGR